ncbi:transposase [Leptospirillum ferriphilum]|uniref:transposase n=1 Tax=Leptospirillum ferriphilum TaxID=178606 RepID=UPI000AF4C174|nr:transposase [Leptospirillum ferriphilum]
MGKVLSILGTYAEAFSPTSGRALCLVEKNNFNDAENIEEAFRNLKVRPIPIKTSGQQDLAMLIAARQGMVEEWTAALAVRILPFLLERGVVLPWDIAYLGTRLLKIIEDEGNTLTQITLTILRVIQEDLGRLTRRIKKLELIMNALMKKDEMSGRLQTIPGVVPIMAGYLIAVIGNRPVFRAYETWQRISFSPPIRTHRGDKVRLESQKWETLVYTVFWWMGTRSAIRSAEMTYSVKMKKGKLRSWIPEIKNRKESLNKVAVALAKEIVLMVFVIWKNGTSCQAAS